MKNKNKKLTGRGLTQKWYNVSSRVSRVRQIHIMNTEKLRNFGILPGSQCLHFKTTKRVIPVFF